MTEEAYERLTQELSALTDVGRDGDVERLCRRAIEDAEPEQARELSCWLHCALGQMARYAAAAEVAGACGRAVCRAYARYCLWDLEGARRALAGLRADPADAAYADHLRGVLAEMAGKDGRTWFERAAKADPENYWVPPVLGE